MLSLTPPGHQSRRLELHQHEPVTKPVPRLLGHVVINTRPGDRERGYVSVSSSKGWYASLRNFDQLSIRRVIALRVQRVPDRLDRLAFQPHLGLLRGAVSFTLVALQTRQHAVYPNATRPPSARGVTWHQRQLFHAGLLAAVLARVVVTFEHVPPAKRHGHRGAAAVVGQRDHFRGTQGPKACPSINRTVSLGPVLPRVGLVIARVHETRADSFHSSTNARATVATSAAAVKERHSVCPIPW